MTDRINATLAAETFLDAAARTEPVLRAFSQIDPQRVRAEAALSDAQGLSGPLAGLPVAVKEVFDVAGYVCNWGTQLLADRRPDADCTVVSRLKAAGAVIVGMTVSTEFALAKPGPTTNPHNPECTPGASSQGSAAAVGAGLVPMALGSQTIGSIIRPAAYCGVVGLMPTHGAVPTDGALALSPPLDHVGLLTARPRLAAQGLAVLTGQPVQSARPERVVVIPPWWPTGTDQIVAEAVAKAASRLEQSGFATTERAVPAEVAAAEATTVDTLLAHDFARLHGALHDRAPEALSARLRDYVRRGRGVAASDYDRALRQRLWAAAAMADLLGGDLALCPATVDLAPRLSCGTGSREPQRLWTLVGFPALTVPVLWSRGMPVGIQLVARPGCEALLWEAADILFASRPAS